MASPPDAIIHALMPGNIGLLGRCWRQSPHKSPHSARACLGWLRHCRNYWPPGPPARLFAKKPNYDRHRRIVRNIQIFSFPRRQSVAIQVRRSNQHPNPALSADSQFQITDPAGKPSHRHRLPPPASSNASIRAERSAVSITRLWVSSIAAMACPSSVVRSPAATAWTTAPTAAGRSAAPAMDGRSTISGRPFRSGQSRRRRISDALMSPATAAVTTACITSPAAASPMASRAISAACRAPLGRPDGLPDCPGCHRPAACLASVVSGSVLLMSSRPRLTPEPRPTLAFQRPA